MSGQPDLPAGGFSSWLGRMRSALAEEREADVPCGECCACCASSHFIHVRPEETETLARIPRELLFAAPGQPEGTMLLGYDKNGRCPMLSGHWCSIYEHRPLTCRTYDCRVFAAAGIAADRAQITQRTGRWKFSHPTRADHAQHAAVQAAARFVRERAECFPGGAAPGDPAQVAVLAIKVSDVFLERGGEPVEPDEPGRVPPDAEVAKAVVEANARFECGRAVPLTSRRLT